MRFRTRLIVNLSDLQYNVGLLQKMHPQKKIVFMVKSNGYGHGSTAIAQFAFDQLQIREFGCATLGEGLILRRNLPGKDFDAYIFSDLEIDKERDFATYKENRLMPVISSLEILNLYLKTLSHGPTQETYHHRIPLCLKFDTGMNRLGLRTGEVQEVISRMQRYGVKEVHHLMTHLACSSSEVDSDELNHHQYQEFLKIKAAFRQANISLKWTSVANSGAIIQNFGVADETHIRPGLMLYGINSLGKEIQHKYPWGGRNISCLETHVLQTKRVEVGERVGYNGTKCQQAGLLVYVGIGYGDGIDNRFSQLKVWYKDLAGEIFGRVSMDMLCIFYPLEAEGKILPGDKIHLWTHDSQQVLSLAEHIRSIPYEILCGLSERVPRIYQNS